MASRVATFTPERLQRAVEALEERIGYEFSPDLVVGIAKGGVRVAEHIFPHLPHLSVALHRPSSGAKNGLAAGVLRRLPRRLADWLRCVESRYLSRKLPIGLPDVSGIAMPAGIASAHRIIVIDDAVDSGVTLDAVLRAISAANPSAEVRSAAITVTTASPLRKPDFMLYDNRTLIRFPWSADYRPPRAKKTARE